MSEKIEKTLKRLAENTSKDGMTTSKDKVRQSRDQMGDPACPLCHGVGYLRKDLPLNDPNFGKLEICPCRQESVRDQIKSRLFEFSNLDELKHMTFETFQPTGRVGLGEQQQDSIERGFNAAKAYANTLQGWLLIQGPYGCGKTHLAAAIANKAVMEGTPVSYTHLTLPTN